jgi:hypothetical protein
MSVSCDSVSPKARVSKKQLRVTCAYFYESVVTAAVDLEPIPRPESGPVSEAVTGRVTFRKFKGSTMTEEKRALVRASLLAEAARRRSLCADAAERRMRQMMALFDQLSWLDSSEPDSSAPEPIYH